MTAVERFSEADKRGWSSYCRREEHKTCRMAGAKCACPCHGSSGQEAAKVDAVVTPISAAGDAPRGEFVCPECGRDFARSQALGRHRTVHGVKGKTATAKKPAERPAPSGARNASSAVPERDLLAVVAGAYHDLNGADFATAIESAAAIIDAIADAGWQVVAK